MIFITKQTKFTECKSHLSFHHTQGIKNRMVLSQKPKLLVELNWDDPTVLAQQVMTGFEQDRFKPAEFAVILGGHDNYTHILTLGTTNLVNSLLEKANHSQKQNAQNLALGLQQSLAVVQEMSGSLNSDEARIRFAEIVASMSKDYFETVKALDNSSNHFWRYAVGAMVTVSVVWLGLAKQEFFNLDREPK